MYTIAKLVHVFFKPFWNISKISRLVRSHVSSFSTSIVALDKPPALERGSARTQIHRNYTQNRDKAIARKLLARERRAFREGKTQKGRYWKE